MEIWLHKLFDWRGLHLAVRHRDHPIVCGIQQGRDRPMVVCLLGVLFRYDCHGSVSDKLFG